MKKIFIALLAFVSISNYAISQVNSKAAPSKNGCGTDCFFTDCTVSCPTGSIPKCKCILGSFGSCGCTQMYKSSDAAAHVSELPTLKNIDKKTIVLDNLRKNGYEDYANFIEGLFNGLTSKNAEIYYTNYSYLENLINTDANKALAVEKIIADSVK